MAYTQPVEPEELAALQARYGAFPQEEVRFPIRSEHFFESARTPLGRTRRAEILAVVVAPDGRILVHTKRFYPPGVYRLLSGGIGVGEPVEDALVREIAEETGLPVVRQCFIGLLAYTMIYREERLRFASYVYRVDVPDTTLHVNDESEEISDFRWIPFSDLPKVRAGLYQVPPEWQDWGRFRALGHDFVLRHGSRCGLDVPPR